MKRRDPPWMMLVEHWSYILYQRDRVIPKYNLEGSVLEIGCGQRGWFSLIAKSYFNSFVCTTDISSEKVHKAKEIARALGIPSDGYVVADAASLPFINGAFDKVIGNAILHHVLENIEAVAKEIFRITKKDGMGIFTGEIVSSRFIGWLWKKLVLNKIPEEGIATRDAWKKAFRNSGFNNVNVLWENRYGYNPSNMRNLYYQVIRHLPEEIVTRYLITSVTIMFNKLPTGKDSDISHQHPLRNQSGR